MSSSPTLKCSICPSNPTFSDVSHLLTHVSSKGHLACYFKHQVRSHQEPEAGKLLAEYDAWYKEHNLAKLLSDRMRTQQKSKRKSQSHSKRRASTGGTSKLCLKHAPPEIYEPEIPAKEFIPIKWEFPSFLDPQLTNDDSHISAPECLQSDTRDPLGGFEDDGVDQKNFFLQCQPQQPEFQDISLNPSFSLLPFDISNADGQLSFLTENVNQAPCSTGAPVKNNQISQIHNEADNQSQFSVLDDPDYINEEEEIRQAKLKGTLWPGMDIFDSATVQMRKRRNQRKDDTALAHMRKTSIAAEPREQIFSPGGTLQTERMISGNVDDWTPIKGESPPARRRLSQPERKALAPAEPNIPQVQKPKRRSRGTGKNGDGLGTPLHSKMTESQDSFGQGISTEGQSLLEKPLPLVPFSAADHASILDDETFMTMSEGITNDHNSIKWDGGFDIFADKAEALQEPRKEEERFMNVVPYATPSNQSTNYEQNNSADALDNHGFPYYQKPYMGHTRANTLPEYSLGKESIYPGLPSGGTFNNCPQFYYPGSPRSIPRPPFQHYENPNPHGYGSNPLAFSLTYVPEEKLQKIAMPIDSKRQQPREASSDATLSDLGKEDFSYVLKDL